MWSQKGTCREVIAVPLEVCRQSAFGLDRRIYAILLCSAFALSHSHRSAYTNLYTRHVQSLQDLRSSIAGVVCFCGCVVAVLLFCFCGGVFCFCAGVVVFLCFLGGGVVAVVWLFFCCCVGGVVVFLCFCGVVVVVWCFFLWWCGRFLWFCGCDFTVEFLWWCFCGGDVVVLWLCVCGGVAVSLCLCGGLCFCGCVFVFLWWRVVFLFWCGCGFAVV